jgi:glycosyltransferase involved in cell wall biosynthesis
MTLIYLDGLNGINYHRLLTPFIRIKEENGLMVHFFENFNEMKEWDLTSVSALVVSRRCSVSNHKEFKKFLVKNNVKLILDNDDFWELAKDNPARKYYEKVESKHILSTIGIADEIWTPSAYLAERMRKVLKGKEVPIRIIPNTVYSKEKQWREIEKEPNESGLVRFGFLGANGHSDDLRMMGMTFEDYEMYTVGLMDYKEILKAKYIMEPLPIHEYGSLYKKFDVSLAPLQNTRFNRCKSELKVVEAGYTKTAIIASNTTPYKQSIIHGKTGLLCSSPAEWRDAVRKMTLAQAEDLGHALHEYCLQHYDIHQLNKERLKGL